MSDTFDWVIIGAGPGGLKAAACAAQAGARVAVIEREPRIGGACVHRGTIPSKALREAARQLQRFFVQAASFGMVMPSELQFAHVRGRLDRVIDSNVRSLVDELAALGVTRIHGSARFVESHAIEVRNPAGQVRRIDASHFVIATGSRPRQPPEIEIDHEHILDSDSVLGLEYLPHSMVILGGGVIACEYASILASLGVLVTLVDRASRPLAFLDPDLSQGFLDAFASLGGRYIGTTNVRSVECDGTANTTTVLETGEELTAEKVMVALGRVPYTAGLGLDAVGVAIDRQGRVTVDGHGRTSAPHVYAVGDVVGPPALASFSMEQGRRAVMHALGGGDEVVAPIVPIGIFTIPELAAVGESEQAARTRLGDVIVGRADFSRLARGQITDEPDGFLKLIADPSGERLLGVGIVGEGATELVHMGQLVMLGSGRVRELVDAVFNFPTMAEAYRVAALDVLAQAASRASSANAA
jgi:NAD(P) transhydrogenase